MQTIRMEAMEPFLFWGSWVFSNMSLEREEEKLIVISTNKSHIGGIKMSSK
jgi:hypothetical protein